MGLFFRLGVMCHWLACGMNVAGTKWMLTAGGELGYMNAVYWAMTTLTTVGYGDVIPSGDSEYVYAICCMVIGGSFYGYLIGKLSSTIAEQDRNRKAFTDKMDEMQDWLESHSEMPKILRHRVKRYFRNHFTQKTITSDLTIMSNLSPALVHDVGFFLLPKEVRCNRLFDNLASSTLVEFLPTVHRTDAEALDNIVSYGDPGTAMYIVIEGVAFLDRGHLPDPTASTFEARHAKELLTTGDSFGEEIILGQEEEYKYHVTARTAMRMYSIGEKQFGEALNSMPEVVRRITENWERARSDKVYGDGARSVEVLPPKALPEPSISWL